MRYFAVCLLLVFATACMPEKKDLHGYVEGEFVYVAPTLTGILQTLHVERGQHVAKGDPLFSLDRTTLDASRRSAQADIDKAKANADAAEKEFTRLSGLAASGASSQSGLDAQTAIREAALATLKSSEQKLAQIDKQLEEISPTAPVAGRIEDTYFRPGEYAAAGMPVVALLPPENVKVRFFVSQAHLPRFPLGASIKVKCDGCSKPIGARITFISSKSEYTPPVIYSVGSRDKLVFMLEAKPDAFDESLRPGLPVDIIEDTP